ncbi:hypothetical protein [Candidatus Regiella endosymbiont of Tuberolachnus salignus]
MGELLDGNMHAAGNRNESPLLRKTLLSTLLFFILALTLPILSGIAQGVVVK